MSKPVALTDLAAAVAEAGPGYLMSTADGSVKAVGVAPVVEGDGVLSVPAPGRGTIANVAGGATQVTLLFPPRAPGGMTLIVDGTAEAVGDDLRMQATGAVLHRPRAHGDGS